MRRDAPIRRLLLFVCILLSFFLFFTCSVAIAEEPLRKVKVGVFITDIYDINFPSNEFTVNGYIWFVHGDKNAKPSESFEIVNAKSVEKSKQLIEERPGGVLYESVKFSAIIKKRWNVTRYPMDSHILQIAIEDFDSDSSVQVYVPDDANSKIEENLHVPGWELGKMCFRVDDYQWESTFGDPSLKKGEFSKYSRLIVNIPVERPEKGLLLLIRAFLGLVISVLIAFISLFVDPRQVDPRFGLAVGALFSAMANQIVNNSVMPETSGIILAEAIFIISYLFILVTIVISTISLRWALNDQEQKFQSLDRFCGVFIPALYALILVSLIILYR